METQARKYGIIRKAKSIVGAGLTALALTYATPMYSQNLPIDPKIASKIVPAIRESKGAEEERERVLYEPEIAKFQAKVAEANNYFNEALEDGTLSLKEQKELLARLEIARETIHQFARNKAKDASSFCKTPGESEYATKTLDSALGGYEWNYHFHDTRLNLPKSESNLVKLLDKNLSGCDIGTPELEKELNKEFANYGATINVEENVSLPEYLSMGLVGLLFIGSVKRFLKATARSANDPGYGAY
jgi:hypothetical protein